MSVEHMAVVLHHSTLRGTAKLVLLGIANHDGDNGAWPSIETLARYAGCTVRQVQRHIASAVAAGELVVHLQDGGTHKTRADRRTNRYDIHVACPPECDGTPQHRTAKAADKAERGDADATPPPVDNSLRGDADDIPRTDYGVTLEVSRGDADDTRTIREPSGKAVCPSVEQKPQTAPEPAPTDGRTDDPAAEKPTPAILDAETPAEPANPGPGMAAPPSPLLADPGFRRWLATAVPGVRRPERFVWPVGELEQLHDAYRATAAPGPATAVPPRFDRDANGPPDDAIPMPDHIADQIRKAIA